jgi:RNA polymerase sigma-70 factor, ECF subfamily
MPFDATPQAPLSDRTLRRWLQSYLELVTRVLRNAGTPAADVDDAVQRTFIVAARRQADVRDGAERSFLLQIALNVAAHARRSVARRREVPVSEAPERVDIDTPERLASLHRERQLLEQVVAELPVDLRTVFVLFELEGRTMAEIAGQLKIPAGTVASRLRRAREQCRQRLQGRSLGAMLPLALAVPDANAQGGGWLSSWLGGFKLSLVAACAAAVVVPLTLRHPDSVSTQAPRSAALTEAAAAAAPPPGTAPAAGLEPVAPVVTPLLVASTARLAPKPASSAEALQLELQRLDATRRRLAAGQADQALALLDAYERATPRGVLKLEAEVLRIDALARSGRLAQAQARAASFLARHPNSVLAARVRRIAGR